MSQHLRRLALLAVVIVSFSALSVHAVAQQRPAYSWDMPIEDVATFSAFTYNAGAITVTFGEGYCGPIVIKLPDDEGVEQPKVTGMEVLAQGKVKIQLGEEILFEDDIRGAMFRFHPDDYETFVSIEGQQPRPEAGLRKLLLHLCYGSFRRFWHRGMQASVPDERVGAAYVYSKQHGGVMIWQNENELVAYCMDTKAELFKR